MIQMKGLLHLNFPLANNIDFSIPTHQFPHHALHPWIHLLQVAPRLCNDPLHLLLQSGEQHLVLHPDIPPFLRQLTPILSVQTSLNNHPANQLLRPYSYLHPFLFVEARH